MRISPISAYSNCSPVRKNPVQNKPQSPSFGMFGTKVDAQIADEYGTPKNKPEIRPFMESTIRTWLAPRFMQDLYEKYFEKPDSKAPMDPVDIMEKSSYVLLYKKDNGTVGVQPIRKAMEEAEDQTIKEEFDRCTRAQRPWTTHLPDGVEFSDLLNRVYHYEYDKNFPPPVYIDPADEISDEVAEAIDLLKTVQA